MGNSASAKQGNPFDQFDAGPDPITYIPGQALQGGAVATVRQPDYGMDFNVSGRVLMAPPPAVPMPQYANPNPIYDQPYFYSVPQPAPIPMIQPQYSPQPTWSAEPVPAAPPQPSYPPSSYSGYPAAQPQPNPFSQFDFPPSPVGQPPFYMGPSAISQPPVYTRQRPVAPATYPIPASPQVRAASVPPAVPIYAAPPPGSQVYAKIWPANTPPAAQQVKPGGADFWGNFVKGLPAGPASLVDIATGINSWIQNKTIEAEARLLTRGDDQRAQRLIQLIHEHENDSPLNRAAAFFRGNSNLADSYRAYAKPTNDFGYGAGQFVGGALIPVAGGPKAGFTIAQNLGRAAAQGAGMSAFQNAGDQVRETGNINPLQLAAASAGGSIVGAAGGGIVMGSGALMKNLLARIGNLVQKIHTEQGQPGVDRFAQTLRNIGVESEHLRQHAEEAAAHSQQDIQNAAAQSPWAQHRTTYDLPVTPSPEAPPALQNTAPTKTTGEFRDLIYRDEIGRNKNKLAVPYQGHPVLDSRLTHGVHQTLGIAKAKADYAAAVLKDYQHRFMDRFVEPGQDSYTLPSGLKITRTTVYHPSFETQQAIDALHNSFATELLPKQAPTFEGLVTQKLGPGGDVRFGRINLPELKQDAERLLAALTVDAEEKARVWSYLHPGNAQKRVDELEKILATKAAAKRPNQKLIAQYSEELRKVKEFRDVANTIHEHLQHLQDELIRFTGDDTAAVHFKGTIRHPDGLSPIVGMQDLEFGVRYRKGGWQSVIPEAHRAAYDAQRKQILNSDANRTARYHYNVDVRSARKVHGMAVEE